ncbi:MAG: ATP-binding protein [Thermoanaerobaculia bacterium]|nr:ATP-binding protein [Thermoanaerobaculia bacterium]
MNPESEHIEITITSRFENIELVQVIAEHICECAGLDDDGSHWVGMAVREGVANAIKHGNRLDTRKRVFTTFDVKNSNLAIHIRDEGDGFDPEQVADPLSPINIMKTSGRGIFYMKTFMDEVDFSFPDGRGTELVMRKNLAGRNGADATD